MILTRMRTLKRYIIVIILLTVAYHGFKPWVFLTYTRNDTSVHWKDVSSNGRHFLDNSQLCKVPVLNPYNPLVLQHVEKANKIRISKCPLERLAQVTTEGILKLKMKNVQRVGIYYIIRQDDFKITSSKRISLLKTKEQYPDRPIILSGCDLYCKESGRCDYCGKNGYCCRRGYENCPSKLVRQASRDHHSCVYNEENTDKKDCHNDCDGSGRCPLSCGENGFCCQRGDKKCPEYLQASSPSDMYSCIASPKPQYIDISYKLDKEFIKLEILMNDTIIEEYHYFVLGQNDNDTFVDNADDGVNIIMLMFDSVSSAMFQRSMKKSYEMLQSDENSFIFKGHSIVGDGTTAQLSAILTGIPEHLLPQAKRSMKMAKPVDNWPFLFKDLHSKQYKTFFSEDDPETGTFNLRLLGFDEPPTLKYLRPYWIAMDQHIKRESLDCSNKVSFDYLRKFLTKFQNHKVFALAIFSAFFHNSMNSLDLADEDIIDFFQYLDNSSLRNKSIIILFGDHGLRVGEFRTTLQGKLEERLPFLSISLPPWFRSYTNEIRHFQDNTNIITSHFDLHATLKHLLTFPSLPPNETKPLHGKSLFEDLKNLNRTCEQSGVANHWCPCFDYQLISVSDPIVLEVVSRTISRINFLNNEYPEVQGKCAHLVLKQVFQSGRAGAKREVVQFANTKQNKACDSCEVDLNRGVHIFQHLYIINFAVLPSDATYEVTAKVLFNEKFKTHTYEQFEISRTNFFGTQPRCVEKKFPHLRKYCLCANEND